MSGARYCDACGAAVGDSAGSDAGELRKTVTIVFADVVGSTSLQERLDPESVRRVMTRFYDAARAVIEAHQGRVVKFTGDGVMAAFGTPVVREDDALRAVHAAAAMVAGLGELNVELERDWGVRLRLRTGVNTGEVVVGGDDGDLVGDPVNVAARLEQAAGAGEVFVGEQTERLVRHDVSLEPVAALELKGKAGTVRAFRLLASVPMPDEGSGTEAALVGRDAELGRLRAVYDGAVADRACRLVTVVGSPGIGKTRLAQELARSVAGEAVVLEGRCEPSDEGITFAPVAEVLRAAAGIGEGDAALAREKLERVLPEDADRELVVERALGVLGAVAAASTEETFWGVRRVLEALARAQPLVVVLDDVHWGQPTFLDLVEHLVEWARDAPLLIVALARPELRELREALVSGRRASDVIELDPLGAAESRSLVDELLGRADLPERLAAQVLRATEGNPLFVGETVRMLVDEGVLRRQGDRWVAAEDVDVEMPPTIHALIAARLERLGDDERAVVERASVIGKQFYRGAVADLCSYPVGRAIDGHLETLRRKELVQPDGTYWIDEPVFRFHHVLIRDAAYRSVLKESRAELHERFADWLESKAGDLIGEQEEVVAFHLEQAHEYRGQLGLLDERGRALGARAAQRLASAGRRALAREDLPAAANLLGRALDRIDERAPERPELLVDLAEALLSAGDTNAATPIIEAFQAAAGEEPRLRALASVYAAQLGYLTDSSHLHEAVETAAAAAEQLAALGDEAGLAKASHVQAVVLGQLGQVGAVEAALDRALAAARRAGDARRVSAVLVGAPLAALWGPSPVVRASGRCLDVVRILRMTAGNRHLEAAALSCQAVLEAMRGRADAARAMLDGCRTTFEELGLGLELLQNEVHTGIVALLDGDPATAEGHLRSAYEEFGRLGAGAGTERAEALLARALLEQGRDDEADALTRIGEERGGEDLKATIALCGVRAEVLARRGEHAAAQELARRGATMAAQTDALTDHADARMALAAVLREAGQDDEAAAEARRALELYGEKENAAGAGRAAIFAGVDVPMAAVDEPAAVTSVTAPPVVERVITRYLAALTARDADELGALMTGDIVFVNRSLLATWEVARGPEAWIELQRSVWTASPDVQHSREFVSGDERGYLTRWRAQGHTEDGGGDWNMTLLYASRLRGERLEHVEQFDEDDEAAARACAERMRTGDVDGESANARLTRRYTDAVNARDWVAADAYLADDLVVIDHRVLATVGRERDRATFFAQTRALPDEASDVRFEYEVVADLDPLVVGRGGWRGHLNDGGGAFELPLVILLRIRDGRCDLIEIFEPDDDVGWCGRLAELLGERGVALAAGAKGLKHLIAHDWDAMRARFSTDAIQRDRRKVGSGEIRGNERITDFYVGLVELAPDLRPHVVRVLDVAPNFYLFRLDVRGHAVDGGEIEVPYLLLGRERNGLLEYVELFDLGDEDAARRRFGELNRAEQPATPRELLDRFVVTYNTRDWDGMRDVFAPDLRVIDRRMVGWGQLEGLETLVKFMDGAVALAPDIRIGAEPLAVGRRAVVARYLSRGHLAAGGGEAEVEFVSLSLRDDKRVTHIEVFDAADAAAALARFEEIGADTEPERLRARICRLMNTRDWDALSDCYADDHELVDHRALGWEPLRGSAAIVDLIRSWVDVAPDVEIWFEVLAGDDQYHAIHHGGRGHAAAEAGAGAMEYDFTFVATVRDGRIAHEELFDAGEEATALARYEELRRSDHPTSPQPGPAASPPTPSRRLVERFVAAYNARDWDDLRDIFAPDLRGLDRHPVGWGTVEGPDTLLKFLQGAVELAPDARLTGEPLALGRRAMVARYLACGHLATGGGEFEREIVLLSVIEDGRVASFEMFVGSDAGAALARFEEIGAQSEHERLCARLCRVRNARDWHALGDCYADDHQTVDHRALGWEPLRGREAMVELYRSWGGVVPDVEVWFETLSVDGGLIAIRHGGRGHAADGGGAMEFVVMCVSAVRDDQFSRTDVFEDGDETAALARIQELIRAGSAGDTP